MGEYDKAITCLDNAISINPKLDESFNLKGSI